MAEDNVIVLAFAAVRTIQQLVAPAYKALFQSVAAFGASKA